MLRSALTLFVLLVLCTGTLGGCGQTGALFLPSETPAQDVESDANPGTETDSEESDPSNR